jgi:hypothetical protein
MIPRSRRARAGSFTFAAIGAAIAALLSLPGLGLSATPSGAGAAPPYAGGSSAAILPINFSTYLGTSTRTNAVLGSPNLVVSSVSPPPLAWRFALTVPIESQPIVESGTLYLGAGDGYEYALSAATGALLWKTYLGVDPNSKGCGPSTLGITSTGTYSGGHLFVLGGNAHAYELNAANGAILWNVSVGGPTTAGFYLWSSPGSTMTRSTSASPVGATPRSFPQGSCASPRRRGRSSPT